MGRGTQLPQLAAVQLHDLWLCKLAYAMPACTILRRTTRLQAPHHQLRFPPPLPAAHTPLRQLTTLFL